MKLKWTIVGILLFVCLGTGSVFALKHFYKITPNRDYQWVENEDIEIIRERMLEDRYDSIVDPSDVIEDLREDGSFASIDYETDKKDTWHPIKHLENILVMEVAAYSPGNHFYLDQELIDGINKAIGYWVESDYYCEWNGWWNDLGSGPIIADILLFPNQNINPSDRTFLAEKLYGMTILAATKTLNVLERDIDATGGNLTDKVNFSLKYGVITQDGSTMAFAKDLMENELRPFPDTVLFQNRWDMEGIKADFSFHQHFQLLYLGGYGQVFAQGMNDYIKYTSGTQFALLDKAVNFYEDFLLDGMQYAMRREYRDINASGRGIVRQGQLIGIYKEVTEGVRILLDSGYSLNRRAELDHLLATRSPESDQGAGGHRYYWNSDYQVYNDSRYMATVRAASSRTKNSEALNGENVLGHYLGAGATMYYLEGDEYLDIFPLWNWNRIPGTTTLQGYLPYGNDNTYVRKGKTEAVGGLSTGKIGLSCLDYDDNKVKAKKAWFMFDQGIVCLGTDISSNSEMEVYTTINQTLASEKTIYSMEGQRTSYDEISKTGTYDWIYQNGIGYISQEEVSSLVK